MASLTSKKTELDLLMPMIRESLAAGHSVTFTPSGVSMLPMLRPDRDTVTLSPLPDGRLQKYDLPLYRRDSGKYVLHRIVQVGETYTCLGDNHIARERGVRHDQMIALVTSFCRDGKEISVTAPGYRLYCRFWYGTRMIRRLWRSLKWRVLWLFGKRGAGTEEN